MGVNTKNRISLHAIIDSLHMAGFLIRLPVYGMSSMPRLATNFPYSITT